MKLSLHYTYYAAFGLHESRCRFYYKYWNNLHTTSTTHSSAFPHIHPVFPIIILGIYREENTWKMPDMKATEPQEVEKEEDQEESEDKPHPAPIKDKKHDSGAADLEKGDSLRSA